MKPSGPRLLRSDYLVDPSFLCVNRFVVSFAITWNRQVMQHDREKINTWKKMKKQNRTNKVLTVDFTRTFYTTIHINDSPDGLLHQFFFGCFIWFIHHFIQLDLTKQWTLVSESLTVNDKLWVLIHQSSHVLTTNLNNTTKNNSLQKKANLSKESDAKLQI